MVFIAVVRHGDEWRMPAHRSALVYACDGRVSANLFCMGRCRTVSACGGGGRESSDQTLVELMPKWG
jgi:hypothetical protein